MKKLGLLLFGFALVVFGSSLVSAAGLSVRFEAPSAFSAGGKQYPAGKYQLESRQETGSVLVLKGLDDTKIQVNLTVLTRVSAQEGSAPLVVFDELDSKLVLSEVHPANADGYILSSTSARHVHRKANTEVK